MAMSSSISDGYLRLHRSTVHPLIALSLPTVFLLCMDAAARAFIPSLTFPPPLFFLALVAIGIEEVTMANVLFVERAGPVARLRELLAVLTAVWLSLVALRGATAHDLRLFHVDFIYPLALAAIQWTCVWAIHRSLREREILLSAIAGAQGEMLLHALRDSSLQAAVSSRSLRAVKLIATSFQAAVFVVLLTAAVLRVRIAALGLLLCAAHAVIGLIVIGALHMFMEDQILLGEGLVVPGRIEAARASSALGLLLACIPVVLLAARGNAPLPLSALLAFFEGLLRLFPAVPTDRLVAAMRSVILRQQQYYEMMRAMPPLPINPLFLLFIELLRRLIPVAILLALYFFLVSPLLSEEFLERMRKRRLIDFIRAKLRAFLRFCRRTALRIRAALRSAYRRAARARAQEPPRDMRAPTAGAFIRRLPLRKRLQMSRVLKAFVQLLQWSESHGLRHRPSDAPQEYAVRFASMFPDQSRRIALVVEVLEEVLFSTHLLPGVRIEGYYSSIRQIRRSGGGQGGGRGREPTSG